METIHQVLSAQTRCDSCGSKVGWNHYLMHKAGKPGIACTDCVRGMEVTGWGHIDLTLWEILRATYNHAVVAFCAPHSDRCHSCGIMHINPNIAPLVRQGIQRQFCKRCAASSGLTGWKPPVLPPVLPDLRAALIVAMA